MRRVRFSFLMALFVVSLACGGSGGIGAVGCSAPGPAPDMMIKATVDPTTTAVITASVKFDGPVPVPKMIRIDGDPKCVAENGGVSQRAAESIVIGSGQSLQNVFVYVKDGPTANYAFPIPADPVVLDQQKCRYTPRVLGVRVGQRLSIHNSDPLLHNVRVEGQVNRPFNMSTPLQGVSFDKTFATREVMVPVRCDVHNWMSAFIGAMDHPFFGVSDADGRVALTGLPPGTYTIEAWHETLGTKTEQITVGPKESKDVSFTFSR